MCGHLSESRTAECFQFLLTAPWSSSLREQGAVSCRNNKQMLTLHCAVIHNPQNSNSSPQRTWVFKHNFLYQELKLHLKHNQRISPNLLWLTWDCVSFHETRASHCVRVALNAQKSQEVHQGNEGENHAKWKKVFLYSYNLCWSLS